MSAAATLLNRLDGVRSTGRGKWIAKCPAHEDKRPSLSVRVADNDVVLLHCFAGCDVAAITAALGLDVSVLFPPRRSDVHAARPRASPLTPLVAAFEHDLLIVHLLLADVAAGKQIGVADRQAAGAAADRVWAALQEAPYVI